jgi:hypothetical protein
MKFTNPKTAPDQSDWNVLNHAIWYGTKGYNTPYPGEQKVLTPAEVPRHAPAAPATAANPIAPAPTDPDGDGH